MAGGRLRHPATGGSRTTRNSSLAMVAFLCAFTERPGGLRLVARCQPSPEIRHRAPELRSTVGLFNSRLG